MGHRADSGRGRAALCVGAFAVTLALLAVVPEADDAPQRVLSLDVLHLALNGRPVEGGVRADELAFFERRVAERPGDPLALHRIASTSLLRFRAYNRHAELDRAASVLEALEEARAGDADVYALGGALALARHRFGDARRAAERRRAIGPPGDEAATLGLFDALWASGRYSEARELVEAGGSGPGSAGRLAREARLLDGLGDVDAARTRMERVVRLVDAYAEPPVVRAWARVEVGHFASHSGDPLAAVDAYAEALALVPAYPAALEGLGWIAYGIDQDLAVAEGLFLRSAVYGSHLDLYPVLREIAAARGADGRAEKYRRTFLELSTRDPREERMYWRPLALTLAAEARTLDEALRYANLDLEQRQDRGAWATRGYVLHLLGRHDEALRDMERALAWGAPEPSVLYRAGQVFLEVGQRTRARGLLRRALEGRAELGPVIGAHVEAMLDSARGRRALHPPNSPSPERVNENRDAGPSSAQRSSTGTALSV